MTLDEDRQKELDQLWLDSLLQESLRPEHDRDLQRIESLFARTELEQSELRSADVRKFSSFVRWLPLVIAASVLIAVSSWPQFSSSNQKAYAAVDRSLRATPAAREYSIRIFLNNLSGDELTRTAQLYLGKNNRFAIRRQSWLASSDIWVGSDGTNQWFVPRVGPAFKGSERILGGWLMRKDSTSPFLHLNTALKRMKKDYDLTMLPDAGLDGVAGEGTIVCERVHGEWKSQVKSSSDRPLPVEIELWADKDSGIARRVVLVWNREPNQVGVKQWSMDLIGYPSLAENWFEPSGHIGAGQRIITIGKETDLEVWPKANEEN
jgi:hypothetical protein